MLNDKSLFEDDHLRIGIQEETRSVILHFGRPISWISLSQNDAVTLAALIVDAAANIRPPGGSPRKGSH